MHSVIEYREARFGDFTVHGFHHSGDRGLFVTAVTIDGQLLVPTPIFWMSLAHCLDCDGYDTDGTDPRHLLQTLIREQPETILGYYVESEARRPRWLVSAEQVKRPGRFRNRVAPHQPEDSWA